ncbi:MAG: hypothetical protein JWM95_5005 [Gemmatimonadetes bacterium]|nr:hypothetical protein [Gemmatimonadota bacterium]
MSTAAAILLALPWVLTPAVTLLRLMRSRSLDEYSADLPEHAPPVSIVVPARNEAHNIERCIRSILASGYPRLEIIAVDDHSTDGTGVILAALAAEDARLRVIVPAPLPAGWFGKQWACTAGFEVSHGDIVGFVDADTQQAADLVPRIVNAMSARHADLLSVGGTQELVGFWEKLVQPQVFSMLAIRYGSTEAVNESVRASDKIANGQCLFVVKAAYVALGGHAAVRDQVAEDLALAQRFFLAGRRTILILGQQQLSTRMYTSLSEVVQGWGKNMFVGGRDAMPHGRAGSILFPLALLMPALMQLIPPSLILCGARGSWLLWAAIVVATHVTWWTLVYSWLRLSLVYVVLYPLGAAFFLYIVLYSIARGERVRWKGREYLTGAAF